MTTRNAVSAPEQETARGMVRLLLVLALLLLPVLTPACPFLLILDLFHCWRCNTDEHMNHSIRS